MTVPASRHATLMDADGFWRQFPVTVRFDEPGKTVVGRIIDLTEIRVREEYLPKIRLSQEDGTVLIIVVGQTRLLAELARLKPAKGDLLKITYHGEAKTAPPGMNATKEFTVAVKRPGTPDPGSQRTPTGSTPRENPP